MIDAAEWEGFLQEIAALAHVPREEIGETTRLVDDLGLDSLALTEAILVMAERFDAEDLLRELEERTWEGVTIADVHAQLSAGARVS